MYISIIIPVYNEREKIAGDIAAAGEFIVKNSFQGEIIVVDDGSDDGTSEAASQAAVPSGVDKHVRRYDEHRGKGYAVKTGVELAKGDHIMFADSGLCIPFDFALKGLDLLASGEYDIAHGSRRLSESKIIQNKPLVRRIIPKIFKWIFIILLGVPRRLTDTQCGFKIYKGDVAHKLYGACSIEGFLFDIEIILLTLRPGYRITEFPVEWTADLDSRLSVRKNSIGVLRELLALRRKFN